MSACSLIAGGACVLLIARRAQVDLDRKMQERALNPVIDQPEVTGPGVDEDKESAAIASQSQANAVDLQCVEPASFLGILSGRRAVPQSRVGPRQKPELFGVARAIRLDFLNGPGEPGSDHGFAISIHDAAPGVVRHATPREPLEYQSAPQSVHGVAFSLHKARPLPSPLIFRRLPNGSAGASPPRCNALRARNVHAPVRVRMSGHTRNIDTVEFVLNLT